MEAFNQAYEEITGANFFKVSDSINCDVKNRGSKYSGQKYRGEQRYIYSKTFKPIGQRKKSNQF